MQSTATSFMEQADRDLERRVANYLVGKHVPGLRHLAVEARGGTVTLRGRVQTFYEKQLCQDCSRRVAGVVRLIDAVDVVAMRPRSAAVA
jgi:osmotically-inducible protein OsmY